MHESDTQPDATTERISQRAGASITIVAGSSPLSPLARKIFADISASHPTVNLK